MTNHVTNLELSKKLAEAGVDVESEFKWWKKSNANEWWEVSNIPGMHNYGYDEYIPAYLLSELLEMFSSGFTLTFWNEDSEGFFNVFLKENTKYNRVKGYYTDDKYLNEMYGTPANAAAKLLLWLIENNHIDPNNLES